MILFKFKGARFFWEGFSEASYFGVMVGQWLLKFPVIGSDYSNSIEGLNYFVFQWFSLGEPYFYFWRGLIWKIFFIGFCLDMGVSSSVSIVSRALNLFFVGVVFEVDLDLFFSSFVSRLCSLGGFFIASPLEEVCGGLTTEATSKERAFVFFVWFYLCLLVWLIWCLSFLWRVVFSNCFYSFHFLD